MLFFQIATADRFYQLEICQLSLSKVLIWVRLRLRAYIHRSKCACVYVSVYVYVCTVFRKKMIMYLIVVPKLQCLGSASIQSLLYLTHLL